MKLNALWNFLISGEFQWSFDTDLECCVCKTLRSWKYMVKLEHPDRNGKNLMLYNRTFFHILAPSHPLPTSEQKNAQFDHVFFEGLQ